MIVGGGIVPATNFTRHEVQRPRPPQVAVMSTPPSCAALRMLVPAATLSSRRVRASPGFVRKTCETAMRRLCSALPRRFKASARYHHTRFHHPPHLLVTRGLGSER